MNSFDHIALLTSLVLTMLPASASASTHIRSSSPLFNPRAIRRNPPESEAVIRRRQFSSKSQAADQVYTDYMLGYQVRYPAEWKITQYDSWSTLGTDRDRVIFENPKYLGTYLAVGIFTLTHSTTIADAEQDFANLTHQPIDSDEAREGKHLLEYALVKSERSTWNGRTSLDSTFTYRYHSKDLKSRQIRIPDGNRIINLEYTASPERFEQDMHYCEDFTQSLSILPPQKNSFVLPALQKRTLRSPTTPNLIQLPRRH